MKRILLVSSLIVPSVLFAVERSVIYLLLITATITLYLLFVLAHRKPTHERAAQHLTGQSDAGTMEQKNLRDQPVMNT
jgi:hypothetical protein